MSSSIDELPQEVTAVGTLGDVGAAYAVYEKNWRCEDCTHENYARRKRCFRCRAPKVERPDALVVDSLGDRHTWREALDPTSNKIYYYNTETNATQWERPAAMGAAPHATGWFGRGKAGANEGDRYEILNATFLSRPARKQLDVMPTANSQLEGAYEYNIWYDKYIGDHWNDTRGKEPAATRCVLALDGGRTKADVVSKANRYFCVHFARGMCARGAECSYYHRLPSAADETRIGMMHDCFGRERHATDRDDMAGVGNFMRNSRTLYVGGLKSCSGREALTAQKEALAKQFGEWGEVENINVIHRKSICFVRYRHRTSAEFAKEAMANQSLQSDEVLNLRWAFDDPNPVAKQAGERADRDAIVAVMQAKGATTTEDAAFDYPEEYQLPATKRQRIEGDTIASYPNTDTQFIAVQNESARAATTCAAPSDEELYAQLSYADPSGKVSMGTPEEDTNDQA
uniref:Pre-mRNA-splicing factor cwc2 n=2 Tax=Hyaloperonospora arabidopsidis (strain Emoy2) TaxID=559515 RepID=M4B593_HYAAE